MHFRNTEPKTIPKTTRSKCISYVRASRTQWQFVLSLPNLTLQFVVTNPNVKKNITYLFPSCLKHIWFKSAIWSALINNFVCSSYIDTVRSVTFRKRLDWDANDVLLFKYILANVETLWDNIKLQLNRRHLFYTLVVKKWNPLVLRTRGLTICWPLVWKTVVSFHSWEFHKMSPHFFNIKLQQE